MISIISIPVSKLLFNLVIKDKLFLFSRLPTLVIVDAISVIFELIFICRFVISESVYILDFTSLFESKYNILFLTNCGILRVPYKSM